jgi:hypothetical protein
VQFGNWNMKEILGEVKRIGNAAKRLAIDREVKTQRKRSEELEVDWELANTEAFFQMGNRVEGVQQVDKMVAFLGTAFLGAMSSAKVIKEFTKGGRRDITALRRMRILQALIVARQQGAWMVAPLKSQKEALKGRSAQQEDEEGENEVVAIE